jgi:uncharacterized protein
MQDRQDVGSVGRGRAARRRLEFVALDGSPLGALVVQRRDDIVALVRQHKARSVAVFGSVARGEATETSDVDFLVEFEPDSSLFDLVRLEDALGSLLGTNVDVISVGALLDRDEEIRRDAVLL